MFLSGDLQIFCDRDENQVRRSLSLFISHISQTYQSRNKKQRKQKLKFISGLNFFQFHLNGFILAEKIYDTYQRKLLVLLSPDLHREKVEYVHSIKVGMIFIT